MKIELAPYMHSAREAQGYKIITLVLKDLTQFKKDLDIMRFDFTNIDDILLA